MSGCPVALDLSGTQCDVPNEEKVRTGLLLLVPVPARVVAINLWFTHFPRSLTHSQCRSQRTCHCADAGSLRTGLSQSGARLFSKEKSASRRKKNNPGKKLALHAQRANFTALKISLTVTVSTCLPNSESAQSRSASSILQFGSSDWRRRQR